MPDWKQGTPLEPDQTEHPVHVQYRLQTALALPFELNHAWTVELWGDGGKGRRLKSWGHRDGKLSAHWIAVRGGIGFHTDPGFTRYSVHLELFNGGFFTGGVGDKPEGDAQLFTPGLVSVLDTWSPHRVIRDERLPFKSPTKVAAAIDFADWPDDVDEAVLELLEWSRTGMELPE